MKKFLFILFACLCSLATWAQTTKSGNANFWYYDYSNSAYHTTYVDDAITKAITSTDVKVGSNLKDNGMYSSYVANTQNSYNSWRMEEIKYTKAQTTADDTNAIDFTINLKDGYNFIPTAVSLTIKGGNGQDTSKESYIDFAWIASSDENGTTTLSEAQKFTSDNATHLYSFSSTDFTGVEASTNSCTLRIHLYGTPNEDHWFVCDVKITGTVTNPEGEKYELTFSPESNVETKEIMRSLDKVIIGAYGDDMELSTLVQNDTPSTTSYYFDGDKDFGFWVYKDNDCVGAIAASTDSCYSTTDMNWTFTSKELDSLKVCPFTDGGTYTIYIPEGIFTAEGLEGTMQNDAYTVSYVITPYGAFDLTPNPTTGSNISALDYVYVAYQGGLTTASSDSQGISIYSNGDLVASSDTTSYVLYPSAYDSATNTYALAVFESSKASEPTSITDPGEYTITIPAKYFMDTNKEAYNNEITLSYTITEATKFDASVTSPIAEIVDEISDFTITPSEGTTISSLSEKEDCQPTLIDGLYNVVAYGVGTIEDDNTVTITLKDAEGNTVILTKDEPDTYMLIVPEGYIIAEDNSVNSRLSAEFTIEKVAVPDEYLFKPETGSTLESLKTIAITNANEDNGLMIKYAPFGEGYEKTDLIVVLNESGNHVSCVPDFGYVEEEFEGEESADTKVTIKFEPEVTIAGEYTVVIPSGLLNFGFDSTDYNEEIKLSYTVVSDVTGFEFSEPEVTSEEVTTLSSTATISLSALEGFAISEDNTEKIAITLSGKEDVAAYATLAEVDGIWTLSFVNASGEATTLSEAGDYVITIPQGYFTGEDGAINPKTLITFSVSLVTFDLTATLGD
ncbi:MAG: hypothetical protein LUC17_02835, partial [Oscillospiraceae bacterium]|nr:hypothetical protein [Oscillospiraceae bacterium]